MKERTYVIKNAVGLHARPAASFVKACKALDCDIQVSADGRTADAKSITGVMQLGVKTDQTICVRVQGANERTEQDALDALGRLVEERFGEPE